MVKAKFDDVWSSYKKPSLDDKLIFRKKHSDQTSPRLLARQEAIASLKPILNDEKQIFDNQIKENKCEPITIYKPGIGIIKGFKCPFHPDERLKQQDQTIKNNNKDINQRILEVINES